MFYNSVGQCARFIALYIGYQVRTIWFHLYVLKNMLLVTYNPLISLFELFCSHSSVVICAATM